MDTRDLQNVQFLLNLSKESMTTWYKNTSADDHLYASEILEKYSTELELKLHLLSMDELQVNSTKEVDIILSKYRL